MILRKSMITHSHGQVLRAVREHPGSSAKELAMYMGKMDDSHVRHCLLDLIDAGKVVKKSTCPTGRRGFTYHPREA